MTGRRRAVLGGVSAVAVAAGVISVLTLTGAFADPDGREYGCEGLSLPERGEMNTTIATESETIELEFDDPRGGVRRVVIPYKDPACQQDARVREVIDHVLEVNEDVEAQICDSMREAAESGRTIDRGRPVNPAAAQKYVDSYC